MSVAASVSRAPTPGTDGHETPGEYNSPEQPENNMRGDTPVNVNDVPTPGKLATSPQHEFNNRKIVDEVITTQDETSQLAEATMMEQTSISEGGADKPSEGLARTDRNTAGETSADRDDTGKSVEAMNTAEEAAVNGANNQDGTGIPNKKASAEQTPAKKTVPKKKGTKVDGYKNAIVSVKAASKKRGKGVAEKDDDEEIDIPSPSKKAKINTETASAPRQRKASTNIPAAKSAIPRTLEECNEADKMMVDWRNAGKPWEEITTEWTKMNGMKRKPSKSTLPNRYERIMLNLAVVREQDNIHILEAKKEVDETYEKEKWSNIAEVVAKRGGDTYKAETLQRHYKKMLAAGKVALSPKKDATDEESS